MGGGGVFLAAYACSGVAGLIYEVTWTRLLTLYMGHTTAAASTVVAAFMGGLAGGSAAGARIAPRLTPRQSLRAYALLEAAVAGLAILLPLELRALKPLLSAAYANGTSGLLFPSVRLIACLIVLVVPALALGATFPLAVRWFVRNPEHSGRGGGALYAANTSGAALGALGAGFLLIPLLGLFGTTVVGMSAGVIALAIALTLARLSNDQRLSTDESAPSDSRVDEPRQVRRRTFTPKRPENRPEKWPKTRGEKRRREKLPETLPEMMNAGAQWWLAAAVLACSGFATLMYEIAWTRIFAMTIGPSTYAFATTLTTIIAATAIGSAIGSAIAGRVRSTSPLVLALAAAAIAVGWSSSAAGTLPHLLIEDIRASPQAASELFVRYALLAAGLIAPAALALGVAFPLALDLAGRRDPSISRRLGTVYAVNTIAAVTGALVAGFVTLPAIGLRDSLRVTGAVLIGAALLVTIFGRLSRIARLAGVMSSAVAITLLAWSAPWDSELLASGAYKYARYVAQTADPESALKAGTLLYHRDGAVATVTVKRLAGVLSLAIDGKVDASTSADMLTQKLLAHLPLLLHANPQEVCVIGLGSGVTLASALRHPVSSVDVVELSPEVVEASRYFDVQNRGALDDPRTHLIVGDGRSHALLSTRKYDVIISEPSNPWMAGVAALFTREFFTALRDRLAPDGILCQWAHTYDISGDDLRSVAATFASVFPGGTMWLVGDGDLLLVASPEPLEPRLINIERNWHRPDVAADLAEVGANGPFALYSLFIGGPNELRRYGSAARLQTDDRMTLEFSGPRAIYGGSTTEDNVQLLHQLLDEQARPPVITRAFASAGAAEWKGRAAMMLQAEVYNVAYQDFVTAVKLEPADADALGGLVRATIAAHHEQDAGTLLTSLVSAHGREPALRVALSKMLAASGRFDEAIAAANEACAVAPTDPSGWEQLASIFADVGDAGRLAPVVDALRRVAPTRATTMYYAAVIEFLNGRQQAALGLAQSATLRNPQYAAAYNLVGAVHASLGESEPARQAFEMAMRLDSKDSATYINLGLLALSSHRSREAADWFAEALSLDPQSPAAQNGLHQAREELR